MVVALVAVVTGGAYAGIMSENLPGKRMEGWQADASPEPLAGSDVSGVGGCAVASRGP